MSTYDTYIKWIEAGSNQAVRDIQSAMLQVYSMLGDRPLGQEVVPTLAECAAFLLWCDDPQAVTEHVDQAIALHPGWDDEAGDLWLLDYSTRMFAKVDELGGPDAVRFQWLMQHRTEDQKTVDEAFDILAMPKAEIRDVGPQDPVAQAGIVLPEVEG